MPVININHQKAIALEKKGEYQTAGNLFYLAYMQESPEVNEMIWSAHKKKNYSPDIGIVDQKKMQLYEQKEKIGFAFYYLITGRNYPSDNKNICGALSKITGGHEKDAKTIVGLMYKTRTFPDLRKEDREGLVLSNLCCAAAKGHKKAQYYLAKIYLKFYEDNREQRTADINTVKKWLLAAAKQDELAAQNELARLLFAGLRKNDESNLENPRYWLERAANLGSLLAKFNLSLLYETGQCVAGGECNENKEIALKMQRELADLDYAPAQYYIARKRFHKSNRDNDREVMTLLKKAVNNKGNPAALVALGTMYMRARGIDGHEYKERRQKALSYYHAAVKKQQYLAALNLAKVDKFIKPLWLGVAHRICTHEQLVSKVKLIRRMIKNIEQPSLLKRFVTILINKNISEEQIISFLNEADQYVGSNAELESRLIVNQIYCEIDKTYRHITRSDNNKKFVNALFKFMQSSASNNVTWISRWKQLDIMFKIILIVLKNKIVIDRAQYCLSGFDKNDFLLFVNHNPRLFNNVVSFLLSKEGSDAGSVDSKKINFTDDRYLLMKIIRAMVESNLMLYLDDGNKILLWHKMNSKDDEIYNKLTDKKLISALTCFVVQYMMKPCSLQGSYDEKITLRENITVNKTIDDKNKIDLIMKIFIEKLGSLKKLMEKHITYRGNIENEFMSEINLKINDIVAKQSNQYQIAEAINEIQRIIKEKALAINSNSFIYNCIYSFSQECYILSMLKRIIKDLDRVVIKDDSFELIEDGRSIVCGDPITDKKEASQCRMCTMM